ncbi:hypothetical protein Q7P35_003649 [Cladosporium inversicolor]
MIPKAPSCLPHCRKDEVQRPGTVLARKRTAEITNKALVLCSVIKLRYGYSIQRGMPNAGAARSDCRSHPGTHHRPRPDRRTQDIDANRGAVWVLAANNGQYTVVCLDYELLPWCNTALRVSLLQLPQGDWQSGAGVNGIAEHGLHSTIGAD